MMRMIMDDFNDNSESDIDDNFDELTVGDFFKTKLKPTLPKAYVLYAETINTLKKCGEIIKTNVPKSAARQEILFNVKILCNMHQMVINNEFGENSTKKELVTFESCNEPTTYMGRPNPTDETVYGEELNGQEPKDTTETTVKDKDKPERNNNRRSLPATYMGRSDPTDKTVDGEELNGQKTKETTEIIKNKGKPGRTNNRRSLPANFMGRLDPTDTVDGKELNGLKPQDTIETVDKNKEKPEKTNNRRSLRINKKTTPKNPPKSTRKTTQLQQNNKCALENSCSVEIQQIPSTSNNETPLEVSKKRKSIDNSYCMPSKVRIYCRREVSITNKLNKSDIIFDSGSSPTQLNNKLKEINEISNYKRSLRPLIPRTYRRNGEILLHEDNGKVFLKGIHSLSKYFLQNENENKSKTENVQKTKTPNYRNNILLKTNEKTESSGSQKSKKSNGRKSGKLKGPSSNKKNKKDIDKTIKELEDELYEAKQARLRLLNEDGLRRSKRKLYVP